MAYRSGLRARKNFPSEASSNDKSHKTRAPEATPIYSIDDAKSGRILTCSIICAQSFYTGSQWPPALSKIVCLFEERKKKNTLKELENQHVWPALVGGRSSWTTFHFRPQGPPVLFSFCVAWSTIKQAFGILRFDPRRNARNTACVKRVDLFSSLHLHAQGAQVHSMKKAGKLLITSMTWELFKNLNKHGMTAERDH